MISRPSRSAVGGLLGIAVAIALCCAASASTRQSVVFAFTGGGDGGNAATSVTFDAAGHAYATTVTGGSFGCGTVDKFTPTTTGLWHEATLWSFTCFRDGKNPHGGVTLDAQGNIYGTTVSGGTAPCAGDGCGTIFRINAMGLQTLYDFKGLADGFGPGGAVVLDKAGNLYGSTPDGGAHHVGVVYQLSHSGLGWTLKVIHAFTGGTDGGVGSLGPLLVDASGDILGIAELGGAHGAGVVFKITPGTGGTFAYHTIYAFKGMPDAAFPYGGVIEDSAGEIFGTTYFGGKSGNGAVYELQPGPGSPAYTERVLHSFAGGTDGANPTTTLVFDRVGDLFGTTSAGGNTCGCGTIFRISHLTGIYSIPHRFGAAMSDGAYPYYGLTPDPSGKLFTSTVAGGTHSQGTLYGIIP